MTGEVYTVTATSGLNLRELPDPAADVLIQLPRGQLVTRLDAKLWKGTWLRVQAELKMMVFQGYISQQFAEPVKATGAGGRGDLRVTEADIKRLASDAKAEFLPGLVAGFQVELPRFQINTGLRVSHFMSQCAHESGNFRYMTELGNDAYFQMYEGRSSLGNTQPGDGARYKGRGIIQLTGRANYRTYGQALGLDLENNPELAAVPQNAVKIACEYWRKKDLNTLADKDDVITITRRINGGLNGLDDRQAKLRIAKSIWGGKVGV